MALQKLTTTYGNLELYLETVTAGAPVAAAAKGALAVNLVEPAVYENIDGFTAWRKFTRENDLLRFIVSPDGPFTSINDAIIAAFATGRPEVVLVAPGTYIEALVTLRPRVSVQGLPSGAFGAPTLQGRVNCPPLGAGGRVTWASVNINNLGASPAISYAGTPGVDTRLALSAFLISSLGKGVEMNGGDASMICAMDNVGTTDPNGTVGLSLDVLTGLALVQKGVWVAGGAGVHVAAGASLFANACFWAGSVTVDAGAVQALLDTTEFLGLLVNNAVGTCIVKNCTFLGGAAPTITGAAGVVVAGTISSTGGAPIHTVQPTRLAGDSPILPLALVTTQGGDGTTTAGFWLVKTYAGADGDLDVSLPARPGGWDVQDAYIVSDGAGGTLQIKRAGDNAAISDAMARGAADVRAQAGSLTLGNAFIALGDAVRLTTAGGGASGGSAFVRVQPR
jgi:hypothetical protein